MSFQFLSTSDTQSFVNIVLANNYISWYWKYIKTQFSNKKMNIEN
jgi:hypothetical protein